MLKLNWRPRAQLDRESIAIYLGQECGNPQAAFRAIKNIDETIARIRELPEIGIPIRHDLLKNKDYRKIYANPYAIYYRFNAKSLTIYRVVHQRKEIDVYTLVDLENN